MNDPQDYEYSGRLSKYPPVLSLLGYFGFGLATIWFSFDRLTQFTEFEKPVPMRGLQPMMQVHWLEKFLYELGGKYLVFGVGMAFGITLLLAGVWRLRSWLLLRNSR